MREDEYVYTADQDYVETYVFDDRYAVLGATPAPYAGTWPGPGPILPAAPASRQVVGAPVAQARGARRDTRRWELDNDVAVRVETRQYELWLGARLELQATERTRLYVLPRVSVAYVEVDARRDERLYLAADGGERHEVARWQDRGRETEWGVGVAVEAGVEVDLDGNWFVGASVGGAWAARTTDVIVGPNDVDVDVGGAQGGFHVGRRF